MSYIYALFSYLKLTRFTIGIFSIFAFICGIVISANNVAPNNETILLISIALFLFFAGGFAINDYFDIERDKINAPERPLPSNKLKKNKALFLSIVLLMGGLFLFSLTNDLPIFLLSIFILFLLITYSGTLKKYWYLSIPSTAFICASPFLYAGIVNNNIVPVFMPFFITFLFVFAREIIKDIKDISGDTLFNLKTLPIIYGEKTAIKIFYLIIILISVVGILAYILNSYTNYYLILFGIINLLLLFSAFRLHQNYSKETIKLVLFLTYLCMPLGIIAFFLNAVN